MNNEYEGAESIYIASMLNHKKKSPNESSISDYNVLREDFPRVVKKLYEAYNTENIEEGIEYIASRLSNEEQTTDIEKMQPIENIKDVLDNYIALFESYQPAWF